MLVRLAPVAVLAACRDDPTSATAPFAIDASLSAAHEITVGTIVTPSPTFIVRNSRGDALANVPVLISVTGGDGRLRNVPQRTSSGPTSIGEWTLDTIARENEVTIVAGSAPPIKVTLLGVAGAPASVSAVPGSLDALAGDVLPGAFALLVRDRYGNPVRGAGVELNVAKGGGDVSPASITTDANGLASGISWRLGRLGGLQQLVATVGTISAEIAASIRSGFDPVVQTYGASMPASLAAALQSAVDRLHAGIVGDVSEVPVLNFDMSRCGVQGETVNMTIDDVLIFATVTPIDGVGRILASAGPCLLRTQSRFPVIGLMRFDADDVEALAANGRLSSVVLHELLHVIGIGTLWRSRDMLVGIGTSDPRFIGAQAGAQCISSGGFNSCGDGRVPVENLGGSGTIEAHWRESTFDQEVMTGFVESHPEMPLSAMTFASLQDLGYTINLLSSDPYQVPPPAAPAPRLSPQLLAPWEMLTIPLFEVTAAGWVRPIVLR